MVTFSPTLLVVAFCVCIANGLPLPNSTSLSLVSERKISTCAPVKKEKWEGSGIKFNKRGELLVVLDSLRSVLVVDEELKVCTGSPEGGTGRGRLSPLPGQVEGDDEVEGWEGVSVLPSGAVVLVTETVEASADLLARVEEVGADLSKELSDETLPFEFSSENKGVEGLATLALPDGTEFLLALCEGNKCLSGDEGKEPGGGTILAFFRPSTRSHWQLNDKIKLSESLDFVDFSGLDVLEAGSMSWTVAVVSQESKGLFLGTLNAKKDEDKPAGVDFFVEEQGFTVLSFPSGYCNVEGVSFLPGSGASTFNLATVSDKSKSDQPETCLDKAQSVQLWKVTL